MPDPTIPPILLVRLKPRLPSGARVVESRRVCHLVPLPESDVVPDALRAYCGATFAPGSADLLEGLSGMPCEPCLATSRIPAFRMLRGLPVGADDTVARVGGWSDRGLRPETVLACRFVLLLLLQDPTRPRTVGEIAARLGQDPRTVGVILLLDAAIGWVAPTADQPESPPQAREWCWRLTDSGVTHARRLLALRVTETFAALATSLGLDTSVVSDPDPSDSGGCSGAPSAAPTGLDLGTDAATRSPVDGEPTTGGGS